MVCSLGNAKMAALARLQAVGRVSQTVIEKVNQQKLIAQYTRRELLEADDANLLDEEDMHIFGLRPMTDPLHLVCCNNCKKPIKASQYAAHAEFCKSINSRVEIIPEPVGPAVNKKRPRKERKKLLIVHANQATSLIEPRKVEPVGYGDINAPKSYVNGQIQKTVLAEATRNAYLNGPNKMNGSSIGPYDVECSENVTLCPSKPLMRKATETPSNPDIPAPLATKIYYSQRSHNLRRAICHMFYEEPNKDSSTDASNLTIHQVNAAAIQTPAPGIEYSEQVVNQQGDIHFLPAQKSGQILAANSGLYLGKSGGFVPSMNTASQLPVNNTLGPHYMSNTYSLAGNVGNSLGPIQQGSGRVPVV